MKSKRARLIILATLFALCSLVVWALAHIQRRPEGLYHSYAIFPHDKSDYLSFSNHVVTLNTCCGNIAFGTYRQDASGQWIWTQPHGTNPPSFHLLQPGAFTITCVDTQNPSSTFTLRRRLSAKIPL